MKIGLFTDTHYRCKDSEGGRNFNSACEKVARVLDIFKSEKCDLVICLGDLIDKEPSHEKEIDNLKKLSTLFDASGLDIIALMGNHDGFCFTKDEFYSVLGEKYEPKAMLIGDKALIFLDACYFASGKRYAPGDSDWTDTFVPAIDKLKSELDMAQGECYIFIHQNLDPEILESHRVSNDAQIRQILEASGKTRAVIQGHYHAGNRSRHNGIDYIAVPAMCEHKFPYEIIEL